MTRSVNVGVIGLQGYGASYFGTFKKRPEVRVVAVCDLAQAAVDKAVATHQVPHGFVSHKDLLSLPEIDAVFIATPHFLHYPMVMDALAAGKHVFCEKPLAIRPEHADEMARTARKLGRVLTCHYNQRQTPYVKTLRHIVQSGMIGDVYHANCRWMARWTGFMFDARTNWRLQMDKAGGGIFIGRGSHLIDAIWYILGRRPIRAIQATMHSHLTGSEVDDFASATLRLDGNATVNIQCSYVAHIPHFGGRMEHEIYGTRGGACYCQSDGEAPALRLGRVDLKDGAYQDCLGELDLAACAAASPTSIVDDFLDAIIEGAEPVVTGEDAAYVTKVLAAGYESARTGKEVTLERN